MISWNVQRFYLIALEANPFEIDGLVVESNIYLVFFSPFSPDLLYWYHTNYHWKMHEIVQMSTELKLRFH